MKCINPLNKGSIFRPPKKINNQKVFFSTTQFIVRMMDFSCDAVTVAGDDQSRKKKGKVHPAGQGNLTFRNTEGWNSKIVGS